MKPLRMLTAGMAAVALGVPALASAAPAPDLTVGPPAISTANEPSKIDVMALWSHPDDDARFTTPCGVWGDLYDIKCGIIMVTRGEGGSNSVGNESGPDLGLRRENEDRASHVRTGTVDIFNIDKVDFFYNTSAPLTERAWNGDDTLRRIVRVIRETRPSVMIGWPPNFDYGHGNHQYAGRLVWEAVAAAADPERFPEQLRGVGAVQPWQVKKVIQQTGYGFAYEGEGGQEGPDCNVGYKPKADNPFTMVGTWSGYESPYTWAESNTAGVPAGTKKTWAQVGAEGGKAHPTQARRMQKEQVKPECLRYAVLDSVVPMQPNGSAQGDKDDALFQGAAKPDAGGFPLETLFSLTPEHFHVAAGEPFKVNVSLQLPTGTVPQGSITLDVPKGWQVSDPVQVGGDAKAEATFTVTPSDDAPVALQQVAAKFSGGGKTAWNSTRVQTVPKVQGLFERSGNSAELDAWNDKHGVHLYGRSPAIDNIGAGETKTVSVEVSNRTSESQSGEVALSVPDGFVVDEAKKPFNDVAPDGTTKVDFVVTHTDPKAAASQVVEFKATTTTTSSTSEETMEMYLVPSTVIPKLSAAPSIDGKADDVYAAEPIPVGTKWEGDDCDPDGTDCGKGSEAKLGWADDALYAHITVVDDTVSAAATPDRCFGHWLVDSVELLADPRGDSADTSGTFKLGMFPFTDDPDGKNGNGKNGPCWSRDADNHQGFSTGPLAKTIAQAPNAPGVEVAVQVKRGSGGKYEGGKYEVEVKVPLDVLPAAVGPTSTAPTGDAATNAQDPKYMGFNLTPYDSDNPNFINDTRTAWSAFGSQQSEPYRWGHAYLDGYQPPAERSAKAKDAVIPDTALKGVESPQTIHQSAVRGVTMSGVQPTDSLTVTDVRFEDDGIVVSYDAKTAGTLRGFVWKGDPRFVPVWTSSCKDDTDGFDACSNDDGKAPKWAPDMGGRLKARELLNVAAGKGEFKIPVSGDVLADLAEDSELLLSWEEQGTQRGDGVTAWAFPIKPAGDAKQPDGPSQGPDDSSSGSRVIPLQPGLPKTGC